MKELEDLHQCHPSLDSSRHCTPVYICKPLLGLRRILDLINKPRATHSTVPEIIHTVQCSLQPTFAYPRLIYVKLALRQDFLELHGPRLGKLPVFRGGLEHAWFLRIYVELEVFPGSSVPERVR
jgi:hypothetical protein